MKRLYHVFILFVGEKYKKKDLNPNNYSLLFKLVCISLLFPAMKGLHTKIWSLQSIFHVDRSWRSYFVNNLFISKFNCFFLLFISCCFCQRMDTRSLYLICWTHDSGWNGKWYWSVWLDPYCHIMGTGHGYPTVFTLRLF